MNVKAIGFAVVGGVVGALVWAAIAYYAHVEIGFVAWGVGGLVGLCSALAGGGGTTNGVVCATIALLSIFAGKCLAVSGAVDDGKDEGMRSLYAELRRDASDFVKLKTDKQVRAFMISRKYSSAKKAADITDEDLEEFKEMRAVMLQEMAEQKPTFAEWKAREDVQVLFANVAADVDVAGLAMNDLNFIDLIFGFLGVATAFKIGSRPSDPDAVVEA